MGSLAEAARRIVAEDESIQSLVSQFGISAEFSAWRAGSPEVDNGVVIYDGRRWRGEPGQFRALADALEDLGPPPKREWILKALATLDALLVGRALGEDEARLKTAAFASKLADYPQAAISAALGRWADRNKFWPAWCELKALLDEEVGPRRRAAWAFRRMADALDAA